jgi:arsenate reductase (thioredoxin)
MAEGFARKYGTDIMRPESAGLSPASIVQPLTKKVMEAKNINIDAQSPKSLNSVPLRTFDLIVNMSGMSLPTRVPMPVREWPIEDPIGRNEEVYEAVRDQIEMAVMMLILELRREAAKQSADAAGSAATGPPKTRTRLQSPKAWKPRQETGKSGRQTYLLLVAVLVVELMVSEEPLVLFFFLDFLVLFMVFVSVLAVEVFWAKSAVTGSSDKPRAAIMIFFI